MSPPGVDSALQRAHKAVDERLPDRSQQAVLGSLDDQGLREIVDRYVDAFERADVDAVVEMLAADGAFTMPPVPTWYRGREAVAAFLTGHVLASENRWRLVPARANGQPAFGNYRWDEERQSFLPRSISVLTLGGEGIAEITTFLGPELALELRAAGRGAARPMIDAAELRERCLAFPGSAETFPFGPETSVFKVAGKMFALSQLAEHPLRVSLKCDPPLAEQLRATYPAVIPGYHLNKQHWNTVIIDGSIPDSAVGDMIEDSYDLVVSKLPASDRRAMDLRDPPYPN